MSEKFFAEGMTHFKDKNGRDLLIQITWKEKMGFIYDPETYSVEKVFNYDTITGEGWGITYDDVNEQFIVSDGSEWLYFWNRDTLKEERRIQVILDFPLVFGEKRGLKYVNELEFMDRRVWANVWYQDVSEMHIRIEKTMST